MSKEFALTEISDEFLRILHQLEDDDFSDEEAIAELEALNFQIEMGCEQLSDYIAELTADKTCIGDRQKQLAERKKRFDSKIEKVKAFLLTLVVKHGNPTKTGGYNIKTPQVTLSVTAEKEKFNVDSEALMDLNTKLNLKLGEKATRYSLLEEMRKGDGLTEFKEDLRLDHRLQEGMTFSLNIKGIDALTLINLVSMMQEKQIETKASVEEFGEKAFDAAKWALIELERLRTQFSDIASLNEEYNKLPKANQKLLTDSRTFFSLSHERTLRTTRN